MADLERMAKGIGEKAITLNNILPLLKVCASNISLSYLNQLLLFDRKPGRCAAGRRGNILAGV